MSRNGITCNSEPPPRAKVPKDGPGPRGFPDCYYVSRTLNSTFRYARFVKRLRALEEEQRKGEENNMKELKDKQSNGFFIRCDRRSLINGVARRVDLCLQSYEQDLDQKRNRLKELYAREEEDNIRKFVVQVQAGRETIWQEKLKRLEYLLQKRKKEHDDKYKETPISKATHIHPCILKIRAKEAQEIQLYQMQEKEARRMAEKEFDNMWHAVTLKEAEALAARLELDAIERYRRDLECKQHSDFQLEVKRQQREKDRERLKQETLMLKSIWEEDNRKEAEAERLQQEKRRQNMEDKEKIREERREALAKQEAEQKRIEATWDSLAGQGLADEKAHIERMRRKERELDICNRKMIELKKELAKLETMDDHLVAAERQRQQDILDQQRCDYVKWSKKTNADVRVAMVEQIKERKEAREALKKELHEQEDYYHQLRKQLDQLHEYKKGVDAETRKQYQRQLLEQIEYNKLLKERALQEEADQLKKYEIATQEYRDEIGRMLCRPFFCEEIHPFMKQMAVKGVKMREKCPCSHSDYCADPPKK